MRVLEARIEAGGGAKGSFSMGGMAVRRKDSKQGAGVFAPAGRNWSSLRVEISIKSKKTSRMIEER